MTTLKTPDLLAQCQANRKALLAENEALQNSFNGLLSERNQLLTALQAIDNLTCNCPLMSLQAQHEFERCKEAEAYKIELAKVVLAIRAIARNHLQQ